MRILWVKIGGLWPLNMGGRLRSFHAIAELAKRHRVTVLTTHGPADDPEGLKANLKDCERIVSVPYLIPKAGTSRFAVALLGSWLSSYPVDLWKCRVPALRSKVDEALSARQRTVSGASGEPRAGLTGAFDVDGFGGLAAGVAFGGSGAGAFTLGNLVADKLSMAGNSSLNMILNPELTFSLFRPQVLR